MHTSSPAPEDFGGRLRAARERKGLSQSDLASRSGLQPSAVSHFETGRRSPSFENLRALADALGVSADYLVGRQEDVGAAGPVAEQMFRHLSKMSESDQKTLADMARILAERNKPKRGA